MNSNCVSINSVFIGSNNRCVVIIIFIKKVGIVCFCQFCSSEFKSSCEYFRIVRKLVPRNRCPFAGRSVELLSYDVSSDNSVMYISAYDYATNAVIFGEINLSSMQFTEIPSETAYSTVRTF